MNFQECTNDSIFHLQFPKADLCRDVLKEQMHLWRLLQQRTQTIYIYINTHIMCIYKYMYTSYISRLNSISKISKSCFQRKEALPTDFVQIWSVFDE